MLFLEYPKCSTCKKAKSFLEENGAVFTARNIKEEKPSYDELKKWHAQSKLPLKRFFNTSGIPYREMELSKKLPSMTEDEQLSLLSTDGMLVKRPLVIGDGFVLTGFREAEWLEKLAGK